MRQKGIMAIESPAHEADFYRRIGGTVYKIRVLTSENSTDTFSDKISHIISREALTEKADYDKIELPQMSQLPEGSSA